MRVLVELFDREAIENVISACMFQPEIVVFLCDERDTSLFKESAVYRLFRRRHMKTRPRFYYFDTASPEEIRRVLLAVMMDYPGCVFDFTGGRDLVLLLAGAFTETYALPCFYIDLARHRFVNLRGCEHLAARFAIPSFSAEDVFAMSGATIHGYGHFAPDAIDAAFERDILAAWNIVECNTRAWAEFVGWLQACCAGTPASVLEVGGATVMRDGRDGHSRARVSPGILENLRDAGLITRFEIHGKAVSLCFKSALHRKCLLNQGIWLELYCFVTARRSGLFGDVRTSVVVDWAGVEGGPDNTKNEVDVLLVNGVTPVFISCKMSLPSPLALSEIKLLSVKFGGSYSRAVLVTAGRFGAENKALRTRAADVGVALLQHDDLAPASLPGALLRIAQG